MESLFGTYRRAVAKDQSESDIGLAVLGTHLGVDGRGKSTEKDTLWKIFDRHFVDKDADKNAKYGLTTPARKRRQMEATKNVLLQLEVEKSNIAAQQEPTSYEPSSPPSEDLISFFNKDAASPWIYVKKSIPELVISGGAAKRKFEANEIDFTNAAKRVRGSFCFQTAEKILLDENLPPLKDSFYLVNTVTTPPLPPPLP